MFVGPQAVNLATVTAALTYTPVNKAGDTMSGVLTLPQVKLTPLTVATLPLAATAGPATLAYVTDATVTTHGTAAVGGGANKVLVISDGTSWIIQ